ncbi:radical SAM protein [Desulfobulbus sp.]|uniref:radical SAM protein n=1 Tax=Desulfobulbus sp. TaxID=895 RepID=UPI00286F4194|nr:radical SAM protein [Desulfobulbus sp.]
MIASAPSPLAAETGTVRKKWKDRMPVALLYPNTYPVAVSNLGFQLVYSLLNRDEGVVCERFVYPADHQPLRSLESSRPLHDFPLVFGSISFEHDYPRLAAMLAAGGLPAYAADRGQTVGPGNPLVVLGGVGVFLNPEPLALFADLMVIGEAEPILKPLMQALAGYGDTPRDRLLLAIASSLPGCYAPGSYRFTWSADGAVTAIEAPAELPPRVSKVIASEPERAAHSTLLSPEAELGMYMVELGRGCSRGCRFCAAGFIYRPPRLWSAEAILNGLEERPPAVDRIGLLGMEMAGGETVDRIAGYLKEHNCSLSFSSLRADRISDQTLELLAASNLKSVAIAADGASERLRLLINKGLGEDDLLAAAERLVRAGILHLKLYVMIGLPSETPADLEELVRLVERLQAGILPIGRNRGRVSVLTLSINCFVPKPWTPFQYCAFGGLTAAEAATATEATALLALKEKIRYLRRMLSAKANLRLKFDHPEQALHQAVYARADRRIGPVLLAIGTGQGFKQACKHNRLDPWQFAIRPRGREERMCWEVIDQGIRPGYLWEEYQRALHGRATGPCEPAICSRCGVCHARP